MAATKPEQLLGELGLDMAAMFIIQDLPCEPVSMTMGVQIGVVFAHAFPEYSRLLSQIADVQLPDVAINRLREWVEKHPIGWRSLDGTVGVQE